MGASLFSFTTLLLQDMYDPSMKISGYVIFRSDVFSSFLSKFKVVWLANPDASSSRSEEVSLLNIPMSFLLFSEEFINFYYVVVLIKR